jgi:hypothetical protein
MGVEILAGDLAGGLDRQGGKTDRHTRYYGRPVARAVFPGKVYSTSWDARKMGKENQKEKAGNEGEQE